MISAIFLPRRGPRPNSAAKVCPAVTLAVDEHSSSHTSPPGVLELTHNHGTESDPNFQGYASGNAEPGRGFGHIAIAVDNVVEACERFERLGVPFKKRLSDGRINYIAFLLDPDG